MMPSKKISPQQSSVSSSIPDLESAVLGRAIKRAFAIARENDLGWAVEEKEYQSIANKFRLTPPDNANETYNLLKYIFKLADMGEVNLRKDKIIRQELGSLEWLHPLLHHKVA